MNCRRQPIKDHNIYHHLPTMAPYCRSCYGRLNIGTCTVCAQPVIAWQGYHTPPLTHKECT